MLTGKINTFDLPVTQEQIDKWKAGLPIQDAMPELNDSQREFMITGITDEIWEEYITDPARANELVVNRILNPKRDD